MEALQATHRGMEGTLAFRSLLITYADGQETATGQGGTPEQETEMATLAIDTRWRDDADGTPGRDRRGRSHQRRRVGPRFLMRTGPQERGHFDRRPATLHGCRRWGEQVSGT